MFFCLTRVYCSKNLLVFLNAYGESFGTEDEDEKKVRRSVGVKRNGAVHCVECLVKFYMIHPQGSLAFSI